MILNWASLLHWWQLQFQGGYIVPASLQEALAGNAKIRWNFCTMLILLYVCSKNYHFVWDVIKNKVLMLIKVWVVYCWYNGVLKVSCSRTYTSEVGNCRHRIQELLLQSYAILLCHKPPLMDLWVSCALCRPINHDNDPRSLEIYTGCLCLYALHANANLNTG